VSDHRDNQNHKVHDQEEWEQLDQARERVIQTIAQNMDLYGIASSIGRLYGTMFFHKKPMTLDEMRDALGMSKTSMSTGVRALSEINMVQKTWIKGVRKDLYTVEEDWYKTFVDLFTTKWRKGIEINEEEINKAKREIEQLANSTQDDELQKAIVEDLKKLEHATEYYSWLKRLVKSFESGDIFKHVPKKEE
jgi:DNA-binding transcriptional regulator GbsR (MarR family)